MKNLILILVGILILTLPAFSELSDSDIERIKEIVKVEGTDSEQRVRAEIKTAIANSEKGMKEHINTKMDGLENLVHLIGMLLIAIILLTAVIIGVPQVYIMIKQRGQDGLRTELNELRAEIELLKQGSKPHSESS